MNPRNLSDEALLRQLDELVHEERETLLAVLHSLQEVNRRRLFTTLGFKSLFDFAMGRLRLSQDQAQRRIQAMRLIREIPAISPKIASGELTLTNIGLADYHIKQEERLGNACFSPAEKLAFLDLVAGKTKREAELALAVVSSMEAHPKPDSERVVSEDHAELKMTIPLSVSPKIDALRDALAATHPRMTLGDLFSLLCDLGIERWCPEYQPAPAQVIAGKRTRSPLHRKVWLRDKGRCTQCGSTRALEVDHIQPRALGGPDTLENLRLLCRPCNQRAAIETFGNEKMDEFLN